MRVKAKKAALIHQQGIISPLRRDFAELKPRCIRSRVAMPLLHYLPGRTDLRVEDRRNGQARHNEGGQVGDKNILKSFLIGPISSIQRVLDTNDDFNGVDTLVSVQDILTGGVGVKRDLKDQSKRQMPLLSEEDFSFYCRLLYDRHLVTGVGGNVSSRVGDKIFITPSGYSLRDMEPDRVVVVSKEGRVLAGGIPTKDAEIHLGILRSRSDIHVVCHIHGAFIVAASTLIKPGPDALPPWFQEAKDWQGQRLKSFLRPHAALYFFKITV
jgi:hypothetical protein